MTSTPNSSPSPVLPASLLQFSIFKPDPFSDSPPLSSKNPTSSQNNFKTGDQRRFNNSTASNNQTLKSTTMVNSFSEPKSVSARIVREEIPVELARSEPVVVPAPHRSGGSSDNEFLNSSPDDLRYEARRRHIRSSEQTTEVVEKKRFIVPASSATANRIVTVSTISSL
jgi:hypothetical protein